MDWVEAAKNNLDLIWVKYEEMRDAFGEDAPCTKRQYSYFSTVRKAYTDLGMIFEDY